MSNYYSIEWNHIFAMKQDVDSQNLQIDLVI